MSQFPQNRGPFGEWHLGETDPGFRIAKILQDDGSSAWIHVGYVVSMKDPASSLSPKAHLVWILFGDSHTNVTSPLPPSWFVYPRFGDSTKPDGFKITMIDSSAEMTALANGGDPWPVFNNWLNSLGLKQPYSVQKLVMYSADFTDSQ